MIYVLDAGHSKETKGKRSFDSKFLEYEQNRIIARMVKEELDKLGIRSYFTYSLDKDFDLGLSKRAEAANAWARGVGAKNCLLISIHFNAYGNEWNNANGWEVYTTKNTTNSDKYATIFWEEAKKVWGDKYGRKMRSDMSDGDPDKEENFTVIAKTICPSILLEQGFYTNREEMEFLLSDEGHRCCTEIIVNSIKRIEGIE